MRPQSYRYNSHATNKHEDWEISSFHGGTEWSLDNKSSAWKHIINIKQTEQAIFIYLEQIGRNKHKYISKNNSRKKEVINLEAKTEGICNNLDEKKRQRKWRNSIIILK